MGDLSRLAAAERDHIDLRRFGILGQVDGLHRESHQTAIGAEAHVGDTRQAEQSLHVERQLLRPEATAQSKPQEQETEHILDSSAPALTDLVSAWDNMVS